MSDHDAASSQDGENQDAESAAPEPTPHDLGWAIFHLACDQMTGAQKVIVGRQMKDQVASYCGRDWDQYEDPADDGGHFEPTPISTAFDLAEPYQYMTAAIAMVGGADHPAPYEYQSFGAECALGLMEQWWSMTPCKRCGEPGDAGSFDLCGDCSEVDLKAVTDGLRRIAVALDDETPKIDTDHADVVYASIAGFEFTIFGEPGDEEVEIEGTTDARSPVTVYADYWDVDYIIKKLTPCPTCGHLLED